MRLERRGDIVHLHFDFHNGAMSTVQCRRLQAAFRQAAESSAKVIVLEGGDDLFSNGIHLNEIEASADPAAESWANIVAMDDLVREIITATDTVVVAALGRNAGAGGAILPLAADFVLVRQSVVLNPHYRNMGWLYGSEYWTYLLPRRVGWERAVQLTEACLPISGRRAARSGWPTRPSRAMPISSPGPSRPSPPRRRSGMPRSPTASACSARRTRTPAARCLSPARADADVPELPPAGRALSPRPQRLRAQASGLLVAALGPHADGAERLETSATPEVIRNAAA